MGSDWTYAFADEAMGLPGNIGVCASAAVLGLCLLWTLLDQWEMVCGGRALVLAAASTRREDGKEVMPIR